jgi:hypothetical protein
MSGVGRRSAQLGERFEVMWPYGATSEDMG